MKMIAMEEEMECHNSVCFLKINLVIALKTTAPSNRIPPNFSKLQRSIPSPEKYIIIDSIGTSRLKIETAARELTAVIFV